MARSWFNTVYQLAENVCFELTPECDPGAYMEWDGDSLPPPLGVIVWPVTFGPWEWLNQVVAKG